MLLHIYQSHQRIGFLEKWKINYKYKKTNCDLIKYRD